MVRGGKPLATLLLVAVTELATSRSHARAEEAFPNLNVAIARARSRSVEVIAARGEERAAEGEAIGARLSSWGNPYLEVFADRGLARSDATAVLQANAWFPVDLSGQRDRRIEENERLRGWRGAERLNAEIGSVARLLRKYGTAVVSAKRVRFFEDIVKISEQEAALFEARLEASDVTTRDAKLAAVDLSRNRMSLLQARADLAAALAAVARAMGVASVGPPDAGQSAPAALWEQIEAEPAELLAKAPALDALSRQANYFAASQAREAAEAHAPLNLIVSAGRDALGGARLGGGLAWTLPILRKNQAARARAAAAEIEAREVAAALRTELRAELHGLIGERQQVEDALAELRTKGEPAARAAWDAAQATERAGKGELLHVVTARRDLVSVRMSGLSLEERTWFLLARLVSITGRLP